MQVCVTSLTSNIILLYHVYILNCFLLLVSLFHKTSQNPPHLCSKPCTDVGDIPNSAYLYRAVREERFHMKCHISCIQVLSFKYPQSLTAEKGLCAGAAG